MRGDGLRAGSGGGNILSWPHRVGLAGAAVMRGEVEESGLRGAAGGPTDPDRVDPFSLGLRCTPAEQGPARGEDHQGWARHKRRRLPLSAPRRSAPRRARRTGSWRRGARRPASGPGALAPFLAVRRAIPGAGSRPGTAAAAGSPPGVTAPGMARQVGGSRIALNTLRDRQLAFAGAPIVSEIGLDLPTCSRPAAGGGRWGRHGLGHRDRRSEARGPGRGPECRLDARGRPSARGARLGPEVERVLLVLPGPAARPWGARRRGEP